MQVFRDTLNLARWVGVLVLFAVLTLPRGVLAQESALDSQAKQLLQAATTYLASQKQFSVDTHSTIEAVLVSGQKIQFDHAVTLSVQRPDKLRAERLGDLVDQVFYYDGDSLTLYNPDDRYYATLPAPPTLEKMLDFARESLNIVAPAADLIYRDAFEILMQDVTSGFIVGKSVLYGARCDHLAFRSPDVDWQIWIQEGSEPLPRKLVITSLDVLHAPQFTVVMNRWNLAPELSEQSFVFSPPEDAQGIKFLTVGGSTSQAE
jgi:hypothetical protein